MNCEFYNLDRKMVVKWSKYAIDDLKNYVQNSKLYATGKLEKYVNNLVLYVNDLQTSTLLGKEFYKCIFATQI